MQLLLVGKNNSPTSFDICQLRFTPTHTQIYPAITLWSLHPSAALWCQQPKDTTSQLSRQCTDPHPYSLVCLEMYFRAKKTL